MRLTSQLITETFPDLDKVERLNTEAFPEEERIPLSEFLRYTDNDDAHFFAFYNEEEFVGFKCQGLLCQLLCHYASLAVSRLWARNH